MGRISRNETSHHSQIHTDTLETRHCMIHCLVSIKFIFYLAARSIEEGYNLYSPSLNPTPARSSTAVVSEPHGCAFLEPPEVIAVYFLQNALISTKFRVKGHGFVKSRG